MYWGPAVMYLIMSLPHYKLAKRLQLRTNVLAYQIGRALWRAGWVGLVWSVVSLLLNFPKILEPVGLFVATCMVGFAAIRCCNELVKKGSKEGNNRPEI